MVNIFKLSATVQSSNDRLQYYVLILIRISLIIAIVWAIIARDWENLSMSMLAYAATHVPTLLERRYRLLLPIEFHVIIVLFLYGSLFLGEIGGAYERFWWWDTLLHLSSGVVLGFVGFLILYVLRIQKKLFMSPTLIASLAFCVALAGGAVWEMIEFLIDHAFGATMQNGNTDTMKDLMIDALGAILVVLAGKSYLKRTHRNLFARFIDNFVTLNPQLFKPKGK